MAKLSPTGKPLCSSCQRLATYRLAGYDRIEQKTFYAYQCDEHKHVTSELILHDYAVTYIPVTEGKKPKRVITIVKNAPSKEAVEQIFRQMQNAGLCQFVACAETFDTTGIHSQVPFSSICIKLCPFCAFFEQPARPVGVHKIGDVPACDMCAAGPDISEMLLDWLEMRQQTAMKQIVTALLGYDDNDQPFANLVFTDGTTQRIEPSMPEWQEAYKQIATCPDKVMARHFEVQHEKA
jgi:hypothetical protein